MNKSFFIAVGLISLMVFANLSFRSHENDPYTRLYHSRIEDFFQSETELAGFISGGNILSDDGRIAIKNKIASARLKLKSIDFWLRYLDPISYRKINGPLPVEWETEVFEKFEPPYKREGAGLTLAELYLDEKNIEKDSLLNLVKASFYSTQLYLADSIAGNLKRFDHFFLANRLYILNLAAIYTTGFECPEKNNIIPELVSMMESVRQIYYSYNESYTGHSINKDYLENYDKALQFAKAQPLDPDSFDHYSFIKDHVNPLFRLNQKMILDYQVRSNNYNDFSLDDNSTSIFSKSLYKGQNSKGVYIAVEDNDPVLSDIREIGKLLFYDPLLSGNNKRSCASCHKPTEYFTDTGRATGMQFDNSQFLSRNTPSLINATYNHLLMLDGRHISLMGQAKDVAINPIELGGKEKDIVKKVMSCEVYEKAFRRFVKLTPNSRKINIDHIVSAITLFFNSFSNDNSPFDDAINEQQAIDPSPVKGFNIFMSKAQCATCHFPPLFNGARPPYIGTEFEVLGVPFDTGFSKISPDSGRAFVNNATQTMNAFRTGTIRNAAFTKPYMHNGVFNTLEEVINFYDAGGGVGRGLKISNQTLSPDSLKLSGTEKQQLLAFIRSLNENIKFEPAPTALPPSRDKNLNNRKVGGEY